MTAFLLAVVVVILIVRWAILSNRYAEMEQRIEMLLRERIEPQEMTRLIRRITKLEETIAALTVAGAVAPKVETPAPQPEPATKVEPVPAAAPLPKPLEPVPAGATLSEPVMAPKPDVVQPVAPIPLFRPAPAPAAPARPSRTSAEWEALVGGNWLNKLGVLVLVIAIALFLGYEFPRLGPAGISTISLALSLTMLLGGVVLEGRARYVIFGRGLIAGGWAGLYFTTYAMQALDAAKVIRNPILGALLLIAVAAGMVLHSLRYREQVLTGFAYFMAFLALAITQVTALSVIALIPLAASLLWVAYRFEWPAMALFGVVATYATCASKPDTGAPLWSAQTVFAAYWLVFEAYDLLRARRRWAHRSEHALLPLNAMGLALLSYTKWAKAAPDDLYLLTIGIATAYLASTVLRAFLRPPASFGPEAGTLERIFGGGFEGPVTLAAAASAAAAILKLHGLTVTNVLLAEGEVLFLAGLFFRQSYPRQLAGTVFAAVGVKLLVTDLPNGGTVTIAGQSLHDWTPSAVLGALLFYVNRALRAAGRSYGYAASALVALIIGYEASLRHVGIVWLGLGAVLFLIGWRWRLGDFRLQGYLSWMLAVGGIAFFQFAILTGSSTPLWHPWISLASAVAIAYLATVCAIRSAADRLGEAERDLLRSTASAVASAAGAALLWKILPDAYVGPAWIALALLALELGLRNWPKEFRWHAQVLGVLGAGQVLIFTILPFHPITLTADRVAIGAAALFAYGLGARIFNESRRAFDVASTCGSFFVMVELWALLGPVLVAPVWALFALLLMSVGFRVNSERLRVQGHAASMAALARLLMVNVEMAYRIPAFIAVAALHYVESWRHRRARNILAEWERLLDRPYLYTAAGLIVLLLYKELQPPFIAVGWAVLAVALLAAGRTWAMDDLCYQSYGVAALVFGRVLALEFSPEQIFATIDQRILTGAIAAACLFGAQFLIPKESRPRLYYSLLATALATALIFEEVSGSMLTVAWGIEGAALLGLGFPLRDRIFRLSGLVLFLVCVGKLFLYDLRALETLYRILSFFVLGVILVSVSWLYTRFRDQIQRYL